MSPLAAIDPLRSEPSGRPLAETGLSPSIALRCWGGEIAVYDDESGDTHLFTGFTAELLGFVVAWNGPRPPTERDVVTGLELAEDEETLATIRAHAEALQRCGVLAAYGLGGDGLFPSALTAFSADR